MPLHIEAAFLLQRVQEAVGVRVVADELELLRDDDRVHGADGRGVVVNVVELLE